MREEGEEIDNCEKPSGCTVIEAAANYTLHPRMN